MFWKPISTNILCTDFNVFYNPPVFYIGFTVVQRLPENDQDRSKRIGIIKNRV
jgi:hypothetical protein